MFEAALETIRRHERIIIHRHLNPDGDAVGSQFGLKEILALNFPAKQIYCVGDESRRFDFLGNLRTDSIPDDLFRGALSVILDTSAPALISDGRYVLAEETLRIDHHIFSEKIADTEITDTSFESCSGMIAAMAEEGGLSLNTCAACLLYVGMVTDSGRFRYDSTSSRSLRLASRLLEFPLDLNVIYENLYAEDLRSIQHKARFTLKIRMTAHHVAYIYSTKQDVAQSGLSANAISRGMTGTMANIRGVHIWANFTETEEGIWCEIRSDKYNIQPIAVRFGGGGHAMASGTTLKTREEARRLLAALDSMEEEND